MKILVTGATGKFGSIVVNRLREKIGTSDLMVSVRDTQKALHLEQAGIEVRQGDFDQPEALVKTFQGVDRLLIISTDGDNETRIRQHLAAVDAAKKAKVGLIVYTSVAKADESTLGLAQVHRTTEEAIKASGIPYRILRNNWYLENEVGSLQGAAAGAPWVTAAGAGKVGWALRREYAQAAANALLLDETENKVYELSGPLYSQREVVAVVENVLGRSIPFIEVDDEAYLQGLKQAGFPDFVADMIGGIQKAIREKALEVESDDFEKLLGHSLVGLKTAIEEVLKNN